MLNRNSPQSAPPNTACPLGIKTQAISWARHAGQIACSYFNNVSVDYKADNSVLTRADIEIEQFLVSQIRSTYPDHGLVGEEGAKNKLASPFLWAIDPLDGTTSFSQGLPGWGISLGLLHEGQPIFGLFYMPQLSDLTVTEASGVSWNEKLLTQPIQPNWGRKGFLAVSTGAHHDFEIDVLRTRALGSVSASLVYTARGAATAALIPKAYLWDLVAGASILKQAGGELRYLSGSPVEYLSLIDGSLAPEPIIASHPDLFAELQSAIRPRGVPAGHDMSG